MREEVPREVNISSRSMAVKSEPVDLELGGEAPLDMSQSNGEVLNLIIRPSPQPEGRQKIQAELVTSPDRRSFLSPPDSLGPVFVSSVSDLLRDPASSRESMTSSAGATVSVEHFLSTQQVGSSEARKPAPQPSGFSDDGDVLFLYSQHALPQDKRDIEFETYIIARDEEEVNSKCLPKKYKCRFCVYKTSYKSDLNRHLRKHGSSVYHCSLCKMPFRTVGNLENHRRLAHACTGAGIYDLGMEPVVSLAGPSSSKRDEPRQPHVRGGRQGSELVTATAPNLFSLVATSPTPSLFAAVAAAAQLRQPASSLLLPHSPHLLSGGARESNGVHQGSPPSLDCAPLLSCRVCGFVCTDSSVYRQHQHSHHQVLMSGLPNDGCTRDPKPCDSSRGLISPTQPLYQRQIRHDHSLQNKYGKKSVVAGRGGVEIKRRRGEICSAMSSPGAFSEGQTRIVRLGANGMSLPHVPVTEAEAFGKACRDVRSSSARKDNAAVEDITLTPASSPNPCIVIEDEPLAEDLSKDSVVQKNGSASVLSCSERTQGMQTAHPAPLAKSQRKEGSSRILNQQPPAFANDFSRSAPSAKDSLNQKSQLPLGSPQPYQTTSLLRPSHDAAASRTLQPPHSIDQTGTEGVSFALARSPESCSFNTTTAASAQGRTVEKRRGEMWKGIKLPVLSCEQKTSHTGDKREAVVDQTPAVKRDLRTYAVDVKTDDEEREGTKRDQDLEELGYVKAEPESPVGKENTANDSTGVDEPGLDTVSQNGDQEMRQDSLRSPHVRENSFRYRDNLPRSFVEDGQNSEGFGNGRGEPLALYVSSSLGRLNMIRDSDESMQANCRRCGEAMSVAEVPDHSRENHGEAGLLAARDSGLAFPSTSSTRHHVMQQRRASYLESCVICARQFASKCFLLKHMQKSHSKVFAQVTSLANTEVIRVKRRVPLPVSHASNSVSFPQKGGASARPAFPRSGHSETMYQDDEGFDDQVWAGSSAVWDSRSSIAGNLARSQDTSRQRLSQPESVPGTSKPQVRAERILDSPTHSVLKFSAHATPCEQAEVLSQPPQTGRFARLVSDFDDFAARPYACALCFFRTSRLWELQAHSQNHLTGCSTAPIPESARFYVSPAFHADQNTSLTPHFTTYEAEGADEDLCSSDAVERLQNCTEEASGPRTTDVSLGRLSETTVNLEEVRSPFSEYSCARQLRTKRIVANTNITDNFDDWELSRSSARKSKHLHDTGGYRSSASIFGSRCEERSKFNAIVSRNHNSKKGCKPTTGGSNLSRKRFRGYAPFAGQRSSRGIVSQSAISAPSVHGVEPGRDHPNRINALENSNRRVASLGKDPDPDNDPSNAAARQKTNDFPVQHFGEENLEQAADRNNLCRETRACALDSASGESVPPAAAGESRPLQRRAVAIANRQQSLKRKTTKLCRFKSAKTAEALRMRRSLHACRDCCKVFTFRQLLLRHVRTFHRC